MKTLLPFFFCAIALVLPRQLCAETLPFSLRLLEVAPAYSRTSVNTAVFRANSVTSHREHQFMAFYDEEENVVLAHRLLGQTEWTLTRTPLKGNCRDAHNVISIALDGDGYLHVAYDHHGHPLRYCRSVAPYSTELGPLQPMLGGREEQDVTYPEFHRLSNGDLLFAYRSGASGRGNLVLNRYVLREARWERVQDVLIDGENKRNAYWQMYVDRSDVIHLSWVWRESWLVETNHDLCYACSRDGGITWQRSDGSGYELPIRLDNAEYAWRIPQGSELINQTSMTADKQGRPYIASYWRDADSQVPQYRLVWFDGRSWQQQQVGNRQTPFSLSGGGTKMIPIARPRLVVDDRGRACYLFRDVERGSKVSAAYCKRLGARAWQIFDLTDFSVGAWEPTIDIELWKDRRCLHVYVQATVQGDGEQQGESVAQPVYLLECQ